MLTLKEGGEMGRLLVSIVLVFAFLPGAAAQAAPGWTVTDLGTLDAVPSGVDSTASAISNRGDVVGESKTSNGETHAFFWRDGLMIDLGTLGGVHSRASDINDRGQVVGTSTTNTGDSHAFLWMDGVMQDLGAMAGANSAATAINNRGQVVGWFIGPGMSDLPHGFLWEGGEWADLGTLPGGCCTEPRDINARGQVVGSTNVGPEQHAFMWESGQMTDLGTLGGDTSIAYGINNRGQIVGETSIGPIPSAHHAFVWEDGVMTDLGSGTQSATGINEQGTIVGNTPERTTGVRGLVWDGRVMTELPTLGGPWGAAAAINDRGQVVGYSQTSGPPALVYHAALWRP